jgi:alkaline phosphatase
MKTQATAETLYNSQSAELTVVTADHDVGVISKLGAVKVAQQPAKLQKQTAPTAKATDGSNPMRHESSRCAAHTMHVPELYKGAGVAQAAVQA